jgi:hypothetical protein
MVRNGKAFGILTTMKGWCFLRREDGGILHLTPMLADFAPVEGVTEGFAAEGYHPTPDYTILKALYYFSHLAETTLDTPEVQMAYLVSSLYRSPLGPRSMWKESSISCPTFTDGQELY